MINKNFICMLLSSVLILLCIFCSTAAGESPEPIYMISFHDYESGSEENWLKDKGFEFKADANRRNRVDLDISDNGLVVEVKRPAFGMMLNESVNVPEFSYVEIEWGVNVFPKGASYEEGVRNEAIMVIFFLGDERHSSGAFFIPDSPYFIGLYLCHGDDRIDYPYVGSFFKKSGRYVCGDRPVPGELVTTRFNLMDAYRQYFDKEQDDNPAVSGIALAWDTKKASDRGKASAFIREIRFYP